MPQFRNRINDKLFFVDTTSIQKTRKWTLKKIMKRVNGATSIIQDFFTIKSKLSRRVYCMVGAGLIEANHLRTIELIQQIELREQGFAVTTVDMHYVTTFHRHKTNGWIVLFTYSRRRKAYVPWRIYEDKPTSDSNHK